MLKLNLVAVLALLTVPVLARNVQSKSSGNWSSSSTWKLGSPASGDNIIIKSGHTVTWDLVTTTLQFQDLTIEVNAKLILNTGTAQLEFVGGSQLSIKDYGYLDIKSDAKFYHEGDLKISGVHSEILLEDTSSVFTLNANSGPSSVITVEGNIHIENGKFILQATNSATVKIGGKDRTKPVLDTVSNITVGTGGILLFEGTDGTIEVKDLGNIVVQEGGEVITNLTGSQVNLILSRENAVLFEYGSSFYQTLGTAAFNFSQNQNSKGIAWEIGLTNDGQGHWRHISSPYPTGTTLGILDSSDFAPNYTIGQRNIFYWDAKTSSAGASAGWTEVASNTEPFEAGGRSYVIYSGNSNFPFTNNGSLKLYNIPDTSFSPKPYTIYNTVDPAASVSPTEGEIGWNLIGNPYVSWLDLHEFLTNEMSGEYQGAHIWDPINGNYSVYLENGETLQSTYSVASGTINTDASRYVRPFQAFWVKMKSTSTDSTTIEIKESYRASYLSETPPTYFKNGVQNRIRIDAFTANDSLWDQILIVINPTAKKGIEANDAFDREPGTGFINLGIQNRKEKLAIDSRPIDSVDAIPLNFTGAQNGELVYFQLNTSDLVPGSTAIIEDLKTHKMHDLSQGNAFTFTQDNSFPQPRFLLHVSNEHIDLEDLHRGKSSFWFVNSTNQLKYTVDSKNWNYTVVNTQGRSMLTGKLQSEVEGNLDLNTLNAGIYIARFTSQNHEKAQTLKFIIH